MVYAVAIIVLSLLAPPPSSANRQKPAAEALTVAGMPPVVVQTEPQAGKTDVDPSLSEIKVTFSKPMQDGNWAFVQINKQHYPQTTGKPRYLEDGRTCVLPVKLEPGKCYVLWINKEPYNSFMDRDAHRAVPYLLVFETKAE